MIRGLRERLRERFNRWRYRREWRGFRWGIFVDLGARRYALSAELTDLLANQPNSNESAAAVLGIIEERIQDFVRAGGHIPIDKQGDLSRFERLLVAYEVDALRREPMVEAERRAWIENAIVQSFRMLGAQTAQNQRMVFGS